MRNSDAGNLNSLDEGLRVRHIANFPLVKPDDDTKQLFKQADYADLDHLPIGEGSRIVGVVERSNPTVTVRRPLDDSVLVAADNPLSQFIRTIHQQPYRLVVDGTAITGIVTWNDLLKLPVTLLAFSLVVQLELAMNARIKEKESRLPGWISLIERKERKSWAGYADFSERISHYPCWNLRTLLTRPRFCAGSCRRRETLGRISTV